MNNLINYKESPNSIMVEVKKSSLRYLDEFIRLKCASDLIISKFFPNAKEITESMSVYNTVRKYLQNDFPFDDKETTCLVVGDGTKPRTGALFAFRTNWNVISIDPNMRTDKSFIKIDRLLPVKSKIEDFHSLLKFIKTKKVLIVCVHSHAKLTDCIKQLKEKDVIIISMPCCVPDDLDVEPDISYNDWGIHSEKRTINIYKTKRNIFYG